MPGKWDSVRTSMERTHSDLYSDGYTATFYNYTGGSYDPAEGEITGRSRSKTDTVDVELVPPEIDSTVDVDGTEASWSTSIRFPESESITGSLVSLGEESERPTEVEVSDVDDSVTVYELHGYRRERGSGMLLARLVEQ